jgi:hypothetical protein
MSVLMGAHRQVLLLDGVCVIGELREACWAAPVVWLVPRRHVGMSPVVAVPVLRCRVGVSANVTGVCMSLVVSPVVCVLCVLCCKCGWLSGQTYTLPHLKKFEWVSDLCPVFIFPSVEGICVGHF